MIVHLHFLRARNSGAFMQNDRAWAAIVGLNDIAIGAADHAAPVGFARFRVSVKVIGATFLPAHGLAHLLRLDDGPFYVALKPVSVGALAGVWLGFQLFADLL